MITEEIEKKLFSMQDAEYRQFASKLMPTVAPERVIGVRTPQLRALAKELSKDSRIEAFLADLPHRYYEENNLHGFIVSLCKDYEKAVAYVDALLPYVDNWATCDLLRPKAFYKNRSLLKREIDRWLDADAPYTVRFGIEMIMSHYLDADFDSDYLERVAAIRSEEYYVNMMIAWYFATALAKQWDSTVPYVEKGCLAAWTHNKTIQKAIESDRIPPERKAYLRTLKHLSKR